MTLEDLICQSIGCSGPMGNVPVLRDIGYRICTSYVALTYKEDT